MKLSNYITVLLLFIASSIISESLSAQRRVSRRDRTERAQDEKAPQDWLAISLGSVGFGRGFSISGKFAYAYELENRISVGANAKFFFDNINRVGPDINLFSYGAAAFTRIKITEEIFAQGEYNYTIFDEEQFANNKRFYPTIGGGYKSGFGPWTAGFHVLYPLDDEVRAFNSLEYWIDFNYKF